MLERFPSQMTYGSSTIYLFHLCQSTPDFTVGIKPENFPKVVLNSQVNIACVSSSLDSSSLSDSMDGEGRRG